MIPLSSPLPVDLGAPVTWDNELRKLKERHPKVRVRSYYDSKLWGWLKKGFLKWAAATTIGYTIYIDPVYIGTERGGVILRHEGKHVDQYAKWWILQGITYFILPIGPSFKAVWEYQAYCVELGATLEQLKGFPLNFVKLVMDNECQRMAGYFCSSSYAWMWPFKKTMYRKFKRYYESLPL